MKRSEINGFIREAKALLAAHSFCLPPWAEWSVAEWKANPETARWCRERQMGWDVTDFGAGDFRKRGLLLFCIRNGRLGAAAEPPYAEKIMVVRENQETPFHTHAHKMEDIIVRGGGNLVIEMIPTGAGGRPVPGDVTVRTDGRLRRLPQRAPLVLGPGESITLPPGLLHRFYAEAGHGSVLAGEVSKVNDDFTDNIFLDAKTRFSTIEEDEPPLHPLWNELPV